MMVRGVPRAAMVPKDTSLPDSCTPEIAVRTKWKMCLQNEPSKLVSLAQSFTSLAATSHVDHVKTSHHKPTKLTHFWTPFPAKKQQQKCVNAPGTQGLLSMFWAWTLLHYSRKFRASFTMASYLVLGCKIRGELPQETAFNPLMPSGSFNICCPRDCVSRTANVEGTARH